jgi:hypothetical protein
MEQDLEFKDTAFKVQILKLQSKIPNQKSILIIPPTGGTNFIDRSYGKLFCENGFDVFILDRWTDDDECCQSWMPRF